jgi:hypothetical protein
LQKVGSGTDGWNYDKNYRQTADITITGTWTPIGSEATPFTGTYEGNLKSISGITITNNANYRGLFGYISGESSFVKSLTLNVNISNAAGSYVGGVAGYLKDGSIQQCSVNGTVRGDSHVGGIVGQMYGGKILYCTVTSSTIEGVNTTVTYAGGIAGNLHINNIIADAGVVNVIDQCGVIGSTVRGAVNVGGVAGRISSGNGMGTTTVQNCYVVSGGSIGKVEGNNSGTGGVVGENDYSSIIGSYCRVEVTGVTNVGGVVGTNSSSNTIETVVNCYSTGNIEGGGNVGGVAGSHSGRMISCYSTGIIKGIVTYNPASSAYTNGDNVGGVVGSVSSGGMDLSNCYAKGNISGGENVGGIAGSFQNSTIENCFAEGNVTSEILPRAGGNTTGHNAGGIAGYFNSSSQNCEIRNSYATGNINGEDNVGGIVGRVLGNNAGFRASVTNCYATGAVTGVNYAGGLVGNIGTGNRAILKNSAALNSGVSSADGSYFRRVAAYAEDPDNQLLHNYASSAMIIAPVSPFLDTLNDVDGESVTPAEYLSYTWWSTAALWETVWNFSGVWEWDINRNLPMLRNMPDL